VGQAARLFERLVVEVVVWAAEGRAARTPAPIVEVNTEFISTPSFSILHQNLLIG
jgi:hypothetical protein